MRTPRELDAALDGIARLIGETLGYRSVVINVHRPAWDDFIASTVHGDDEVRAALLGTTHSWSEWAPLLHDRFNRRGAQIILGEDSAEVADRVGTTYTPAGSGRSDDPTAYDPEDMYLVVMRDNAAEPIGILSVDEPLSGKRPSDEEIDGLVTVAGFAGLAIAQAQEAARVAGHRAALEHLLAVSSQIADARSADVVQRAVCNGIRDALGFERVAAMLAAPDGHLRPAATAGWDPEDPALQISFTVRDFERIMLPQWEQQGAYLIEHEDAARILELGEDGSYRSRLNGNGPLAWSRHWLVVPMRGLDGVLRGLIWADDPVDRLVPSRSKLQALRLFADQALAALEAADHLERTQHLAEHDALTGLPNRALLFERLRHALSRSLRSDKTIALLFLDLDRFKAINDTWGHEAGDHVLRTIAARIDESLRPFDTVARLGGDEFVVLCEDVEGEDAALDIARRLRASLARADRRAGRLRRSLGERRRRAARRGQRGRGGAPARGRHRDVPRQAPRPRRVGDREPRTACRRQRPRTRRALAARRDRTAARSTSSTSRSSTCRPAASNAPRRCCAGSTRTSAGSRRWSSSRSPRSPGRSSSSAASCSPRPAASTRTGASASASLRRASRSTSPPASCATRDLVEVAGGMLARDGHRPGRLAFEITESVLLDGDPETRRTLQALRSLGAPLQLDDFGTGYSSLGYLRDFPVDGIKIDRAFVGQLHSDPADRAIVEAVVLMAKALHLHVVAEGVERTEQRTLLEALGISLVQGFLFSRPAPAAAIEELLVRDARALAA